MIRPTPPGNRALSTVRGRPGPEGHPGPPGPQTGACGAEEAEVVPELPRTGYRPAVDYLTEALQGSGKAIAKHVDAHLTNERVLDLAGAIERAVAIAVRRKLEETATAVLALQVEVLDRVDTGELPPIEDRPLHVMSCDDCRGDLDGAGHYPDCPSQGDS